MSGQNSQQIAVVAAALSNQLRAGIPIEQAVRRLVRIQPKFNWTGVADRISRGDPLSETIVDLWPKILVSAVAAGERSGTMPEVMKQIEEMMRLQQQIKGMLKQFIMPAFYAVAGIGVFVFFMVWVLPNTSKTLSAMMSHKQAPSAAMQLSAWMHSVLVDHWVESSMAVGALIISVIWLFNQPEFRDWLFTTGAGMPKLGDALRQLYFGLWARTLATLYAAGGIGMEDMLRLSAEILPSIFRPGVIRMAEEVIKRDIGDAGDPDKQVADDPRREWPFYIGVAFVLAGQTGRLDEEMQRIAPIMIDEGMKSIGIILLISSRVVMAISALILVLPFSAYYMEMAKIMQQAMRG